GDVRSRNSLRELAVAQSETVAVYCPDVLEKFCELLHLANLGNGKIVDESLLPGQISAYRFPPLDYRVGLFGGVEQGRIDQAIDRRATPDAYSQDGHDH